MMDAAHLDVLIVGAGLSGIGMAHNLQRRCPNKSYLILEGRDAIGGTWDLFRYPGIRSDSDMFTLGYNFKPWTDMKAIADGPSIRAYVRETAAEAGIDQHIRFNHMVKRASWDSASARWTVEAEHGGRLVRYTCGFLMMCAGYYSYKAGYLPEFPGYDRFKGALIHPQKWPEDLEYAGKRVLIIGSGATAVTLLPEMAKTAGHVTMLQRSPTYMVSRPAVDPFATFMRRVLPVKAAYAVIRWKNVLQQAYTYTICQKAPKKLAEYLIGEAAKKLPAGYDVKTHFTPRYGPWDERLCLVPDDDIFNAISSGKASVETDTIETFTEAGVKLASGRELEADIIVTATGLNLEVLGGLEVSVDGQRQDLSKAMVYKNLMYSNLPNLANVFGYTNASWTLRADLIAETVCNLLNHMESKGFGQATPRVRGTGVTLDEAPPLRSGYFARGYARLPKQGSAAPWRLTQNYIVDLIKTRFTTFDGPELEFLPKPLAQPEAAAEKPRVKAA